MKDSNSEGLEAVLKKHKTDFSMQYNGVTYISIPLQQTTEALTAYINEVVDKVIGEDEKMATEEFGLSPDDVYMPTDTIRTLRNDLRAEQRTKAKDVLAILKDTKTPATDSSGDDAWPDTSPDAKERVTEL